MPSPPEPPHPATVAFVHYILKFARDVGERVYDLADVYRDCDISQEMLAAFLIDLERYAVQQGLEDQVQVARQIAVPKNNLPSRPLTLEDRAIILDLFQKFVVAIQSLRSKEQEFEKELHTFAEARPDILATTAMEDVVDLLAQELRAIPPKDRHVRTYYGLLMPLLSRLPKEDRHRILARFETKASYKECLTSLP
jgi:hypothetical protein